MVKSQNELFEALSKEKVIKKEITDTLLELDVLPSVATQAYMNDLLYDLYKRVLNEDINIEVISGSNKTTSDELCQWVINNFTEYSSNMFMESIRSN